MTKEWGELGISSVHDLHRHVNDILAAPYLSYAGAPSAVSLDYKGDALETPRGLEARKHQNLTTHLGIPAVNELQVLLDATLAAAAALATACDAGEHGGYALLPSPRCLPRIDVGVGMHAMATFTALAAAAAAAAAAGSTAAGDVHKGGGQEGQGLQAPGVVGILGGNDSAVADLGGDEGVFGPLVQALEVGEGQLILVKLCKTSQGDADEANAGDGGLGNALDE
eukprot:1148299-Pelagomonas_calceolata.AAC.2